jgi:class 3 adenylate cyclase
MGLRDDLTTEVEGIFRGQWSTRDGQVVPEDDDVQLGNDAVKLKATVLYADLADSTDLVDGYKDYFAAEIYKAFLACAARLIKAESGAVTAYDGDRIMAVYIGGSKNTAAVRTAMKIRYAVDEIVNTARRNQYPKNEYPVRHVIGIDTSDLFVARTGVRGANDLVWVGRAANYAAKLAALPETRSTYITEEVFNAMHASVKFAKNGTGGPLWTPLTWDTFDDRPIYGSTWRWRVG